MNNVHRIDEFLKLMAVCAKRNNFLTYKDVYANLIYIGVPEKRYSVSSNFEIWVDHFKNTDNINVFVSPNWKYFCQFKNAKPENSNVYGMIKLYVPLDKDHIRDGAIKLFDYMARENIGHISKIGTHIRFDNIVIRVSSSAEADKIINFVNNDRYLKEGALPTSPFAFSEKNVSISWDGMLSYNEVVSSWISEYINFEKRNDNLDNVGYSRFLAFVKTKSQSLFVDGVGLDELVEKLESERMLDIDGGIEWQLLNYRDITNLMVGHLDLEHKMDKDDVYGYTKMVSDSKYQEEQVSQIDELCNDKKKILFNEQQKAAFKLAFNYMCESYGYEGTKAHFMSYIKTGNIKLISRYKGARDLIQSNGITSDLASKIALNWKLEALNNAMDTTYRKYGYSQLYSAVSSMIENNDFSRFTNDSNCRQELKRRFLDEDSMEVIKSFLRNEGYDVNVTNIEIVERVLENFLNKNRNKSARL